MKILAVSALLCAMMALTRAAALPDAETGYETGDVEASVAPTDPPVASKGKHHVVKRSTSCPCGWTENYDRCFFYVSRKMRWPEAEKNCNSMNGNLASVRSIEEYQAIQRVILTATNANGNAWIGGSDAQQEHVWFWSDGTPFTYLNWCRGQPDNKYNQNCMQMNYGDHKCWDDVGCTHTLPSVCAKKM
ncbi:type-2 ice-structuring protein-like isoform X2 [Pempheris klunzingeri]|uniref:type-2 ice-structuring protein-like isoform X2 n=1 Tax=Pempheris klunzingeri TaxID=3127111 RepID=UPI0039802D19